MRRPKRWLKIVTRIDGSHTIKDHTGRVYARFSGSGAYNDAVRELRRLLKEKRRSAA